MADELSDLVKARKDLIWGLFTDVRAHARHAETLRSNVVNFIIVVASVLIAAIANDGHVKGAEIPLCLLVVLVGLLGLGFAASYTELHVRNRNRAVHLREVLDKEYFDGADYTLSSLLDEADAVHEAGRLYRSSRQITGSTQRFWFLLPGLVLVSGVVLTIIAL